MVYRFVTVVKDHKIRPKRSFYRFYFEHVFLSRVLMLQKLKTSVLDLCCSSCGTQTIFQENSLDIFLGDGPSKLQSTLTWSTFNAHLAPVVHRLVSAIHRIKIYAVDSAISLPNTCPLDSDLSGRQRYSAFEQPGPDEHRPTRSLLNIQKRKTEKKG